MNDSIEQRLLILEQQLQEINLRNQRVSNDKAWEVSLIRRSLVAALTYCFASAALWAIGVDRPFVNGLTPTCGYIVSTFSIRSAKALWVRNR